MKPELEKMITKEDWLQKGYQPLNGKSLKNLIVDTTVTGDYEYNGHRIYKTYLGKEGTMEATNDWGNHLFGRYTVDKHGHFSVFWDGYWDEWTGIAFHTEKALRFYHIESGEWITTFHTILQGRHNLEIRQPHLTS